MTQHDFTVDNSTGLAVRNDFNDALQALATLSSGATTPSTTFADQVWLDTSASPPVLWVRNAGNTAWDLSAATNGFFNTRAAVAAATIEADVDIVTTKGYATFGDGGGAVYKRVGSEPSHALKVQSADGAWWELVPEDGLLYLKTNGVVADYVRSSSTGADQATAINEVLSAATTMGIPIVVGFAGHFRIDSTIDIPDNVALIAPSAAGMADDDDYTSLLRMVLVCVGTGPTAHSITTDDLGAGYEMGGEVDNPSSGESYTTTHGTGSDTYKLLDLTNGDASGTTRATAKSFSAGIKLNKGSGLRGIMITNNNGGIFAPEDTGTDFGDDWDVGIWAANADRAEVHGVTSWGHWRMAGLLYTPYDDGTITGQAERSRFTQSFFRGFRGVAIRGTTGHTTTASTSTTLEIAWSASHRWPTSGNFVTATQTYAYTGLSNATDKLTFTGVTPDPSGEGVNTEVYYDVASFGLAMALFDHCIIWDMLHRSFRYVVDDYFGGNAFPDQSGALEISGRNIRQVVFSDCTIAAREDIGIWLHDARNIVFSGGYMEARAGLNQSGSSLPRANRLIALKENSAIHTASYVTKGARELIFADNWIVSQTMFEPAFNIDDDGQNKFGTSSPGLCDPATTWFARYHLGFENEDGLGATGAQRLGWHPRVKTASDFDGLLSVFRDDATDATDFPVGEILSVYAGGTAVTRRETKSVYRDASNGDRYTIFASGNTILDGTWRHIGKTGELNSSALTFHLFRRVT